MTGGLGDMNRDRMDTDATDSEPHAPVGEPEELTTEKRQRGFIRAFFASVLGTGLSRILGAVRDIFIARLLGAGAGSDAFWVAFTVPNVFRRFVADEGLTGALIPAVAKTEDEEGRAEAKRLANTTFTALLLANLLLCVVGIFGAEFLVKAFAYEFTEDPAKFELCVTLTRWLFPFVTFVSLVSFCEALLNHRGHFFVPKLAPGVVSFFIALSAVLLGTRFDQPEFALVVGVLVGGAVHVLVNVPPLLKRWGRIGFSFTFGNDRFRQLMRELGKVVAIGIFAQLNVLVLRQLAAALGDGALTHYWYANRLVDLAQGMIAVGIGSALLPMITRSLNQGDMQAFRSDLARAIRLAAFILLPVAVVLLTFGEPITAVLFRHGRYTWEDVRWTVMTLYCLVPYLLAVAGINIVKKAYFAFDERNTLLKVGALGVLLTGGLGWALIGSWHLMGLAAALSISAVVQLAAYLAILRFRLLKGELGLKKVVGPMLKMTYAALPSGLVLLGMDQLGQWERGPAHVTNIVVLIAGLTAAGVSYLVMARLLRLAELTSLVGRLRRRR